VAGYAKEFNVKRQEWHHKAKGCARQETSQPGDGEVAFPVNATLRGSHNAPDNRENQREKAGKRKSYPAKYAPEVGKEANLKAFLAK